ncbi:hypothetical protein K491DRAFT_292656 [Lophiostoma macrostomum CBS 122681]|uniref:Uncharacterized protein n=1 Tax=Lophiostoma macrostomum CBS 122681 TaxID=1314788 RepID=A0A6A6SKY5_9PLEO|nr:hypothetical protein K491DRAFT_292656 [Lophiostoma macrostomum CBS 122681]
MYCLHNILVHSPPRSKHCLSIPRPYAICPCHDFPLGFWCSCSASITSRPAISTPWVHRRPWHKLSVKKWGQTPRPFPPQPRPSPRIFLGIHLSIMCWPREVL